MFKMKVERLIKALEKIGVKVEKKERWYTDCLTGKKEPGAAQYFGHNEKNKISFYDQDVSMVCCQIMGIKSNNDYMTDYFPGFFARTIKSAIQDMGY